MPFPVGARLIRLVVVRGNHSEQDFRKVLDTAVGKADVFISVVGPQWLELLDAQSGEAADFVCFEVASALRRNIPIVPLLVGNAQMPTAEDLPEDIRDFAFCNAFPLDPGRDFGVHISRLIDDLDRHYGAGKLPSPSATSRDRSAAKPRMAPWVWLLAAAAILVAKLFAIRPFLIDDATQDPPNLQGPRMEKSSSNSLDSILSTNLATPSPPRRT